jgi:hypothetical protein
VGAQLSRQVSNGCAREKRQNGSKALLLEELVEGRKGSSVCDDLDLSIWNSLDFALFLPSFYRVQPMC